MFSRFRSFAPSLRWFALLTIGVVFTIGGAGMIATGAQHGWAVFLFFGLCTAVFINEVWPNLFWRSSSPPDDLLRRFPGPVELKVDRRKHLFLLIGAAIFAGVALWFLRHEQVGWLDAILVWPGIIMFGAAIPVMALLMLRGASLRLDGEGLEVRQGWRRSRTRWADTGIFEVAMLATAIVVYDDAAVKGGKMALINASLTGRSSGLPDTYGLSPEALAGLLNQWRGRALAVGGGPRQGS
jgi:hypothetical protein